MVKNSNKTVNIPDNLPYPKMVDLQILHKLFHGKLIYLVKAYPLSGLDVVICRKHDHVMMRFSDFDGNILTVTDANVDDIGNLYARKLAVFMKLIKVDQASFYFSQCPKLTLVDFRMSINKFSGPGFLRDFMSKVVPTQDVEKIILYDEIPKYIENKDEKYIIKPSRFMTTVIDDEIVPAYGIIDKSNEKDYNNWISLFK